jgi:acyl-CoA thioester hydrolase
MVDLQQHVANHEIVRLLVEAAIRHSDALGWDLSAYREIGAWWVVRRHEVDFLTPARLGDELLCYTWPTTAAKASADRRHVLVRAEDEAVIANARNTWALLDMTTGRPRRIPQAMRDAFDPAKWSDDT